jgi:ferredoxin-NADP reductase
VLLARREIAPGLLQLEVSRPRGFQYRAGQHVKLGVGGVLRTYSLVSAPHQSELEFFVEVFPGGRLSERLRSLAPGAALTVGERAKGKLRPDAGRPVQLLVATGTGIAPYVSLLRDHLHRGPAGRRFVVLHGASHADELGYHEELAAMATRHPDTITYVPTVSRPDGPRSRGWVERVAGPLVARLGSTPADTAVFACGNPGMVRNIAEDFRRRGFRVFTEPFD